MENESETSGSRPSKPVRILKLKITKRCNQHVCPVCSKGFDSGKALGGHIRIHMKGNNNNNGRHRRISKPKKRISTKRSDEAVDLRALNDEEDDEVVSCCVGNKEFKSMKSLFGHMRNHPERSWRGIRPPPSDKNSCCSSVSEDGEAMEVHQLSFQSQENSEEEEVLEAAYCLMKMARGDSIDPGQSSFGCQGNFSPTDNPPIHETRKTMVKSADAEIIENSTCSDQFHKLPRKLVEEGFYPKNPSGQFEARAPETLEGQHLYSELVFRGRAGGATEGNHQVCSHKILDVDLNEPYMPLDHEGIWIT
ncbi:hypothetical protein HRI_003127500 [Hibiscus trionum]|uniref:C2H2-type domain-containing protein n=1 Tax=Hibiscus trionum TaxID=183268 RepID=A0A9W7IG79_HIBTR|nr:hypothetical protein HRI_003127500 [Hibiscus trionum]